MKNLILAVATIAGISASAQAAPHKKHRVTRTAHSHRPVRPHQLHRPHVYHRRIYFVSYHLHGPRMKQFHNHAMAHGMMNYLCGLGFKVSMRYSHGHYYVYYSMHGWKTRRFISHVAAHAFKRGVKNVGADAKMIRR